MTAVNRPGQRDHATCASPPPTQSRRRVVATAGRDRHLLSSRRCRRTNGIYFNGPSIIRRKTRLAASGGLAGVSIWEIGQDARGPRSLLRVISQSRRTTTDRR
ncbi:hypothetical protein OAJ60_01730 [Planctomycetaceae bacterium]|nr:hypothetical protein [Planctomycetaceae bacterium]